MISYAITVNDEVKELQTLVELLLKHKKDEDEIVIIRDATTNDSAVKLYLDNLENVNVFEHTFDDNFSKMKNFMNSCCKQPWIFNLDADELPHETLLDNIHEILTENSEIDAIWIPRINIVNGITVEHINKWGWSMNEKGWINWPNDAQCRIYKNHPDIYWIKPVHEQLSGTGIKKVSKLPDIEDLAIYHIKDIERQEKQNSYYSTLQGK